MKSKPKILVIYTGGTIGMIKSELGMYVPFSVDGLLGYVPQIYTLGVDIVIESFEKPMDSALIGPKQWVTISKIISKNYDLVDGFVILHGTDTMAYTSSALSFLLRGLSKPVILTGAQVPIYEEKSDGVDNFINAIEIAGQGVVKEVALWFHKTLFKGACVTKSDSKSFSGFSSPNHEPLATKEKAIKYNKGAFDTGELDRIFFFSINAEILYINLLPSINKEIQAKVINENPIQGIVLSVFGSGTVPLIQEDLLTAALQDKNIPIIAVSECYRGGVEIGKYEAGSILNDLNVISGQKMTKEAAITKLMVAIGNFKNEQEIRNYLIQNQVGEF
ncbi:MAG: asparaginase [Flavobacteriales bacterium]